MKKILIIDDEKDLCLLLKSYLQKKHDVYVAYRLTDGLEKALEVTPDIVFLDNNLPDGHGWDKTDWFQEKFPAAHIILMSAFKSAPANGFASNHIHVIEKPVSFSLLENAMQQL